MALFGFDNGRPMDRNTVGYTFHALLDNMSRLFLQSLLCVLALLPGAAGFSLGLLWERPQILLLSGLFGGALFGPFYAGLTDACLMAYRGYPGRWGSRFFRVLRREWKGCLIPGMAMGAVLAMGANVLVSIRSGTPLPAMMFPSMILALLVAIVAFTWFWPQKVLLDLGVRDLLKNGSILALSHPLATLGCVLLRLLYGGIMLILIPYSLLFLVLLGLWFPCFFSVRIIYGALDRELKIEERLDSLEPEA